MRNDNSPEQPNAYQKFVHSRGAEVVAIFLFLTIIGLLAWTFMAPCLQQQPYERF
jgi:hypothetical protein